MNSSHWVAIAALTLLSASVAFDLRSRTIPDSLSIMLVALGLVATAMRWHEPGWSQLGGGLAVAFTLGAGLFYLGAMGGGDAKLCAGTGAVCGWPNILEVLFAIAICGGVLALIAKRRGQDSIAYAPAIAGGYTITTAIAWATPAHAGLWQLITRSSW